MQKMGFLQRDRSKSSPHVPQQVLLTSTYSKQQTDICYSTVIANTESYKCLVQQEGCTAKTIQSVASQKPGSHDKKKCGSLASASSSSLLFSSLVRDTFSSSLLLGRGRYRMPHIIPTSIIAACNDGQSELSLPNHMLSTGISFILLVPRI